MAFQLSPLDDSNRYQLQSKIVTPLFQFFLLWNKKMFKLVAYASL